MNLILTNSCKHFSNQISHNELAYRLIYFDDGEQYIKVTTHLQNQPVWVIAATPAPSDNFTELLFILDALQRQNALINLMITYFGYARQDRASEGEALSAEVLSKCINLFTIKSINIIHAHSDALHHFLPFENVYPLSVLCPLTQNYDYIVAPDHGAQSFVQHVSDICKIPAIFLKKERLKKDEAHVTVFDDHQDIKGKRLLIIDDLISTGHTMISASDMLQAHGAQIIDIYATHGLFSGDCYERILASNINQVYVTNSLHQIPRQRLNTIDIAPFLLSCME